MHNALLKVLSVAHKKGVLVGKLVQMLSLEQTSKPAQLIAVPVLIPRSLNVPYHQLGVRSGVQIQRIGKAVSMRALLAAPSHTVRSHSLLLSLAWTAELFSRIQRATQEHQSRRFVLRRAANAAFADTVRVTAQMARGQRTSAAELPLPAKSTRGS
jgi:hypothetical protein